MAFGRNVKKTAIIKPNQRLLTSRLPLAHFGVDEFA